MGWPYLSRTHLLRWRISRISHRFTDILVIGSGVAGLSAAIAAARAAEDLEVLLIAKSELEECSTLYAQGGIAAVLDPELNSDSTENHLSDTIEAAKGLADPRTVEVVVTEGVERVRDLIQWGARFDIHDGGRIHFTREGGHSHPRILHTADSTGREIERVLLDTAARQPNISSLPNTFAIDLLVRDGGACCGAMVHRPAGVLQAIWARRTILATGGAGRLYRETTNPPGSSGDGIAMAFRAGATIRDMEFVQFHPTALYVAGADRFLITEAVRGEGGKLIDRHGERFMERFHPRAELAPRDAVSLGIIRRMKETGDNKVFLDLSSIPPQRILDRFPGIHRICRGFGIDITREPIPVRPSAHYTIGGIRVDLDGATDVPGLYAAGEVASTGLHGANRLASNSLLEGLVFGKRAGARAAAEVRGRAELEGPFEPRAAIHPSPPPLRGGAVVHPSLPPLRGGAASPEEARGSGRIDIADLQVSLQSLLWHRAGIERAGTELRAALRQVEEWISYALPITFGDAAGWTLQNMLTTAYLIIRGALRREESRGVHYRADFPQAREEWRRHQEVSRESLRRESEG